jgi:hypothetical protein
MTQATQPQSYKAMAIANVIAMLAQSANFQSLFPVGSNPLNYIVECWGGTIDYNQGQTNTAIATNGATVNTTQPHAIVHEPKIRNEFAGYGAYHYRGSAEIEIYQLRTMPTDASAGDVLRRGDNIQDGINVDILNAFGSGTNVLATGETESEGPWLPDEASVDAALIQGRITITWWA